MQEKIANWQIHDIAGRRKYVNGAERLRFLRCLRSQPLDRAILCLLLTFTGCRVSEALQLTRDHIDLERHTVTFRTLKRRKLAFRTVPIPEALCRAIAALPAIPGEPYWPMHRTTAWRGVRSVAEMSQITGPRACPRGLRHGFGIHAASSNVPPNLIQRWMGHASPATTAIYLDAVGAEEIGFAERMWTDL